MKSQRYPKHNRLPTAKLPSPPLPVLSLLERVQEIRLQISAWLACFLIISACSSSPTKKGALDPEERKDYIENYGAEISWEVRKAFIDGKVTPGMNKHLVVFLVGNPDRTAVENFGVSWEKSSDPVIDQSDTQDSIWEYLDSKSGNVRFGLRFKADVVRSVDGDIP